jgi:predicted RNA binding protein YcfA (HicA-like mRNA interferase family)
MPKLPVLTPKELVKILKRAGFVEYRQKGSHLMMVSEKLNKQVTVPIHNKPLKKGTLAAILRSAELSVEHLV